MHREKNAIGSGFFGEGRKEWAHRHAAFPLIWGGISKILRQYGRQRKNLRLDGGGRRLVQTILLPNSLLTGKNTGNFMNFPGQIPLQAAVTASLWTTSSPEHQFQP
jgi:hypothetical protein